MIDLYSPNDQFFWLDFHIRHGLFHHYVKLVADEYYTQHHDPFIHHRHGIVYLNFNIMNHITFIVLLLNFLIKTYSLNMLIVCHIELFAITVSLHQTFSLSSNILCFGWLTFSIKYYLLN